jgi:AcrR family transcriptional regulator
VELAARAGVGVGTVYRRFASKEALIDELLRLALEEVMSATERALARTDGHGLEELLRALGRSFADQQRSPHVLPAAVEAGPATPVLTADSAAAGPYWRGNSLG